MVKRERGERERERLEKLKVLNVRLNNFNKIDF